MPHRNQTRAVAVVDSNGLPTTAVVDAERFGVFTAAAPSFAHLVAQDGNVQGRDAKEALAFLVSQLAYTEGTTYERLYQPMQYEELIPLDYSAGEWAESIRYELMDYVGRGKRTSGRGKDYPKVDVAYADKSFPVVSGAIGYEFTQDELRKTAYLRRPLSQTKPMAAIEGFKRHMNDVGLFGEGEGSGALTGLFNNPFVPVTSNPSGSDWRSLVSSGQELILQDINYMILSIWEATQFNEMPTHIVLPPASFALLTNTRSSQYSDKTLLQWVKENNVAKVKNNVDIVFTPGYDLDTAGVGGIGRVMAYIKRPDRVVMHIPMPIRFLSPQPDGLSIEVPGEYKYSGVEIRYPKSALYMDMVVSN